jgi:hypothetical protein
MVLKAMTHRYLLSFRVCKSCNTLSASREPWKSFKYNIVFHFHNLVLHIVITPISQRIHRDIGRSLCITKATTKVKLEFEVSFFYPEAHILTDLYPATPLADG